MMWTYFDKGHERLVEKCRDYEVEGVRPRGRPKKAWSEVVETVRPDS